MDESALINAENKIRELVKTIVNGEKVNFTIKDIIDDVCDAMNKDIEEKVFDRVQKEVNKS